jgi:hypothetical protein
LESHDSDEEAEEGESEDKDDEDEDCCFRELLFLFLRFFDFDGT